MKSNSYQWYSLGGKKWKSSTFQRCGKIFGIRNWPNLIWSMRFHAIPLRFAHRVVHQNSPSNERCRQSILESSLKWRVAYANLCRVAALCLLNTHGYLTMPTVATVATVGANSQWPMQFVEGISRIPFKFTRTHWGTARRSSQDSVSNAALTKCGDDKCAECISQN